MNEDRIAALERKVAELERRLANVGPQTYGPLPQARPYYERMDGTPAVPYEVQKFWVGDGWKP